MSNQFPFADLFKQSFDFNQLFATQRRNIEALSACNQAIVEGAQAVSRLQAEAIRENVENLLKASRESLTSGTPETNISNQAELAREVVEATLNNFREVTELCTKTSFEAFDVLNKRASESLEEIGQASTGTKSRKKAA